MTVPFAEVIGDPVAQSKSPMIHGFWGDRLSIAAEYRATRVTKAELADYMHERRGDTAWRGCNVTMPLKQAIIPYLDRIDPSAEAIGSVNTLTRDAAGRLIGTSTDGAGFLEPLIEPLQKPHLFRMARIIGAGGAARAIAHALVSQNFTLVIAARRPEQAEELVAQLPERTQHHVVPLAHFSAPTDFAFDDRRGLLDLVVNASPLGMRGKDPLAFDWTHAPPGAIAYDIVTDPLDTEFLRLARAAGHETIDGLAMLIGQAAAAFRLFFGRDAPRQHDVELRRLITG